MHGEQWMDNEVGSGSWLRENAAARRCRPYPNKPATMTGPRRVPRAPKEDLDLNVVTRILANEKIPSTGPALRFTQPLRCFTHPVGK
jgi:hypothetical protein